MAVNKVPSWSFPQNKWKKQPELEIENCVRLPTIGSGRSYGDSNFLGKLTSSKSKFKELFFDPNGNSVTLGGGVTIYEAVLFLSQYQRTLAVVPGTMEATIEGCIASNIHGKNSHKVGSFANTLLSFSIRTENGYSEITREKSEIWNLTIGGQGLTGEIISATLKTVPLLSTSLASKYI
jgi:FAD/FMN-containing dehydrogenase